MTTSPLRATARSFARAGLTDLVLDPRATLRAWDHDGALHSWAGCGTRAQSVIVRLSFAEALTRSACPGCGAELAQGRTAGPALAVLFELRAADSLVRSVARFAQDPGRRGAAPARSRTLARNVEIAQARLQTAGAPAAWPELHQAVLGAQARLSEAEQALRRLQRDPALVAAIEGRVADQLVPPSLRGIVQLDRTPVLLGIAWHGYAGAKVLEVIDAYSVGAGDGFVLLRCPRFVADYLHRYYARGSSWSGAILSVPAVDVTDAQARVAASLWAPTATPPGPLADLGAAVAAARMCLQETRPALAG